MKKLILQLSILISLLFTLLPVNAVYGFNDVPANAYYAPAVNWAVNHNPAVTTGTSATTFSPNAKCTRAQAVTFLWRAMGCPDAVHPYNPFVDVKQGSWYEKAVMWAKEKRITTGTDAYHFSPNAACTRAQIVSFLWRAMSMPEPSNNSSAFRDVKRGSYYEKAVLWACNHNPVITTGTSRYAFSPDSACTRAQIVTFLYRLNPKQQAEQAPYLMAGYAWAEENKYFDIARIDWKCDRDAVDTYWCVMNWYAASEEDGRYTGVADGSGYAGFQDIGGVHKVIMSLWNTDRGKPVVEYSKSGNSADFTGEGTGVQVLMEYPWQVGVWYTMQIEARTENGKTVYYQYVTPENGQTELICAVSFPRPNIGFTWLCAFQEDWLSNNLSRSCYLRNAWTRTLGNEYWDRRNDYWVSNTSRNAAGTNNVRYNCDFAKAGNTLWMQSGGSDYSIKCRIALPGWITVDE